MTATVDDHGFADIARHYLAPGLHGSAFLPLDQLSGFTLLLGVLPTIVATYEFTVRWDALLDGFDDALISDAVTAIVAVDTRYPAPGRFLRDEDTGAGPHLRDRRRSSLLVHDRRAAPLLRRPAQPRHRGTHREPIIERIDWDPALSVGGDALLECEQAPHLYMIGDHNICGLEDADITGLDAANQITAHHAAPPGVSSGPPPAGGGPTAL